ncbi:hypothetical protein JKP88DRAFT_203132 [Tribonema minus]|uniref:Tetratricopeptide repeat protein 27 n=1 Tax=Tribonema minus TaxID=303371 RepID=A0A835YIY8_9STRA|nr:hypothetical protein JKP88DRAFT_203132 [Tribonema minus]
MSNSVIRTSRVQAPSTLSAIDLCTVLALCLDVANSNPRDGLTNEQMSPYIDRVLRTPSNWMIYSTALLQRAWIEFERPHLAERSALQLQALLDQHTTRLTITQASVQSVEESAKVPERLAYIHSITYPPRWELKRDMAQRYAKLGVYGSAAEIFVELELWDEAVECYAAMQLEGAAEKIVRARLAEAETPQMRCALGDLTQDPQHYERAWRLSGGRLARAKTALGRYFFFKGDYETAVAHFQAAVAVKPLLPRAWFTLGAALMRLERWPEALAAFTRVVAQEPDDGEAWGNCGAIHLRAGEYERASAALAQALRQNRASWRMWDNQITALLHLERWDEAVYAMHRFLDLRDKHQQPPDTGALAILAQAASGVDGGSGGAAAAADVPLVKAVAELLGRVAASIKSDAQAWEVYAVFNERLARGADKVADCRAKQCRALLARSGWERNPEAIAQVADASEKLSAAYRAQGTPAALYQAKMHLKSCCSKVQAGRDAVECEGHLKLQALLAEVTAKPAA